MTGTRTTAKAVDAYLAKVPAEQRAALLKLRRTIRAAAPKAQEVMSYGIPAFRQDGDLVYYAAFRDHCSFFPGGGAVRTTFAAELKPFKGGRGTVHFTPEHPLPAGLVTRIVKARVRQNASRAAAKGKARRRD